MQSEELREGFDIRETLSTSLPASGLTTSDILSSKDYRDFSFRQYFNISSRFLPFRFPTKKELFVTRWNLWKQFPWQKIKGKVILKVSISGSLPLTTPARSLFSPAISEKDYESVSSLEEITNLFLFAASDPRVEGVLLELGPLSCGYGKLFEITRLIQYFKQSHKPIVAYAETMSEKEFFLASQCHSRFMPPEGNLDLRGAVTSVTFLRDVFEKIGIEPQVQRLGKYKSFGDTFNRQNMSEAQREVISSLLLQSSGFWVQSISELLQKNLLEVLSLWNYSDSSNKSSLVRSVSDYEEMGLLTGVLYFDQVERYLETAILKEKVAAYNRPRNVVFRWLYNLYYRLFPLYPFRADRKLSFSHNNSEEVTTITVNESEATDLLRTAFVGSRAHFFDHEDSFNLSEEFRRFPRRVLSDEASLSDRDEQISSPNNTREEVAPSNETVGNDSGASESQTSSVDASPEVSYKYPKWFYRKLKEISGRNFLDAMSGQSFFSGAAKLAANAVFPRMWEPVKYFPAQKYLRRMKNGYRILQGLPIKTTSTGRRIGVINAAGSINTGSSSGSGIGSDTIISLLREAKEDEEIQGVILRIDSPGGSALASDLVWREIRALARVKPVVASMVDVAASGGYYFAMACDQIVAEELTVTGSIGVVLTKFNTKKLNEKLGIGTETVSIGKFAEVFSSARGFTPEESEYFEDAAKKAYQCFVEKAAASRSMNFSAMNEVAQGRVWTGRQAQARGLVDHFGGMWKALEVVQQLIDQPVSVLPVSDSERSRGAKDLLKSWSKKRKEKTTEGPLKPIAIEYLEETPGLFGGLRRRRSESFSRVKTFLRSSSQSPLVDPVLAVAPEEIYYSGFVDSREHYGELGEYSLKLGLHPHLFQQLLPASLRRVLEQIIRGDNALSAGGRL